MSDSLLTFLQHLREFGLVFQRKASGPVERGSDVHPPRERPAPRGVFMPADIFVLRMCFCALDSPSWDMKLAVLRPAFVPPVFSPQRKSRRYYPTRLAITLATGVTSSSLHTPAAGPTPDAGFGSGSGDAGFIVVETNYRIYAYTSRSEPSGSSHLLE